MLIAQAVFKCNMYTVGKLVVTYMYLDVVLRFWYPDLHVDMVHIVQ